MKDLLGNEFKVGQIVARSNSHYADLVLGEILNITAKRLRVVDLRYKSTKYMSKGSIIAPEACVVVKEAQNDT